MGLIPDMPVSSEKQTRIIGLTGGTGSGKSEVAKVFLNHGIPVINADQIGHELLYPGGAAETAVMDAFGDSICTNGAIDRKKLGNLVFGDPRLLNQLNALVHPLIKREVVRRCAKCIEEGHDLIIIDAALLAEDRQKSNFLDGLIVVHCLREVRIRRLIEQRGLTREEAVKRVQAQTPPECKLPLADWVIENNGSLAELQSKTELIIEELRNESGEHS